MPVFDREQGGRLIRLAWIKGVQMYFPGEPKTSYIAPWEEMREWEQEIIANMYEQVSAFLLAGDLKRQPNALTREQGGRLIRLLWIIQIYRLFPQPKEAYIQTWENMPAWERDVDSDIFAAIEREVKSEQGSETTKTRD